MPITPVGDGVADDTAAVQSYFAAGAVLPPGKFRITSDIVQTSTGVMVPGYQLLGTHMLLSTIIADYNGNSSAGAIVRFDTSSASKYTIGGAVKNIGITQATSRTVTGLNGIQLTAAWFANIDHVYISGLSGHGMFAPLRPDINAISDYYQDYAVIVNQCWITNSQGWGINFGAGQSPGLFKIQYSTISGNAGGGIRTTTGQCEIIENTIVANGTYGGQGGLLFDTAEGPSMVPFVARNEIQDNYNWNLCLFRSRNMELIQNRFLSQTYSSNQGGSPQYGTAFMRPLVDVNLGSGASYEVYNLHAARNLHRSISAGTTLATTASHYAYDASVNSLSSNFPCVFEHNDFGPWPPDGVTQNSAGLVKYAGPMPGAVITDP